ncbi:MAG: putative rane protein [Lachnospiraceae bacterium]|jgi:LysM repeat protein|nr:putative rane protein [Lachnospiraceae bacterium]
MENSNSKSDLMNGSAVRLPKNIRQIGYFGGSKRVIYVEDYVMTFMKQLAQKEHSGLRIAVLLGHYVQTESGRNLFIKGAVEMNESNLNQETAFSDEGWTSVYENIKRYFTDVEIVGWSLVGPGFFIESGEAIHKMHTNNFHGPDKALLKIDNMEKEEAFYFLEHNQLVKQTGYYIYYEKNEEMQNYMVENKDPVHEEADFNDQTTRKIRTVIQEKKDPKEDKSIVRLMYTASTLMAIIVLVIAATMLKNYEQMRDMQVAIHALSENLGNQAQANDGDTDATDAMPVTNIDTPSTDSKTADDQTKDGKDIVEVETVAGNVEPTKEADAGQNQQTEDNDHSTDGNNNNGTAEIAEGTGNNSSATEETKAAAAETKAATEETKEASAETNEVKETVKETKYYVVKSGDSLAGISFKLYSSANYVTKIMELNGIEDQDKIYAGQTLIVP